MVDARSSVNQRIGARVWELRATRGLSLDALEGRSGVSRSMLSLIERGESSPTAVVLEKLARGLGVPLASLFARPEDGSKESRSPLSRREDQTEWQDPASGYRRRSVSPKGAAQPMQITEVHFPAGARVAFENGGGNARAFQQVWMLEGKMDITVDNECHHLGQGDCLAMRLDKPIILHNPTRRPAHYVVVIVSETMPRR
jgi:transcriptional regulator with XRE-family HTH domain